MRNPRAGTVDDYEQRMLRVLVHIQQNLDEQLRLEELAALAHFSPFHFHRVFRGMVGESLKAHIRRIRLERAAWSLKNGSRPVLELALEAGYESHEAFTRAFRVLTGVSPSEFRRVVQERWQAKSPNDVHFDPKGRVSALRLAEGGNNVMEARLLKLDALRVAFVRHVGPYDQCGTAWDTLCTHLGAEGLLGPGARMVGVSYDDPEITPAEKIRYDACVTVDGSFEPGGRIGVQVLEGGEYAVAMHVGPYQRLADTYAALCGRCVPAMGRELRSAAALEFYLNDPEGTEPEELLTEVHVPLCPVEVP